MRSSRVGKGRRDPRVGLADSNRFSPVHSRVPPPGGYRSTDGHARPRIPEKAGARVSGWQDVRYRTDPSIQTRSRRIGSVRGTGQRRVTRGSPRRGGWVVAISRVVPRRRATAEKGEGRLGCPGRPSDDLWRGSGGVTGGGPPGRGRGLGPARNARYFPNTLASSSGLRRSSGGPRRANRDQRRRLRGRSRPYGSHGGSRPRTQRCGRGLCGGPAARRRADARNVRPETRRRSCTGGASVKVWNDYAE